MFRVVALPYERFEACFSMSEAELAAVSARRVVADDKPGYPCRVSLMDAEVGEELVLLNYEHQTADTPYRACGPVYVRKGAKTAAPGVDEVPEMLRQRLLSLRAYNRKGMLLDAAVVKGVNTELEIERMFEDARTDEIHVHNAGPGCFNCRVVRA